MSGSESDESDENLDDGLVLDSTIEEKFRSIKDAVMAESRGGIMRVERPNENKMEIIPLNIIGLARIYVKIKSPSYSIKITKLWRNRDPQIHRLDRTEYETNNLEVCIESINWSLSQGTRFREDQVPNPTVRSRNHRNHRLRPASAPAKARRFGANAPTLTLLGRLVDTIHLQV